MKHCRSNLDRTDDTKEELYALMEMDELQSLFSSSVIDTSAGLGSDHSAMHKLQERVFGWSAQNPSEGVSGSVAEHISRVLTEMARRKDSGKLKGDVSTYIEEISRYVKDLYPTTSDGSMQKKAEEELQAKARQFMKFLEDERSAGSKPGVVIECPIPSEDALSNPTARAALEIAGLTIGGETEIVLLTNRMRELAARLGSDAKMLRFWGKILTTGSQDYYIAEALLPSLPEEEAPRNVKEAEEIFTAPEVRGRPGANLYTYFVIQDISSANAWVELPQITPRVLEASRSCKRLFTGKLSKRMDDAPSGQWPPFEASEEEYLRSVIARISATSILAIEGEWTAAPEDEESLSGLEKLIQGDVIRSEGFEIPSPQELLSKDKWVHARPYLLRSGRTQHPAGLPEPQEGEEEAMELLSNRLEQLATEDPPIKRFTSIAADSRIQVPGMPVEEVEEGEEAVDPMDCWRIRLVGDPVSYTTAEGSSSPGVVAVESLRWPGAATIAQQSSGVLSNVYVGYGVRKDQPSLLPVEGPAVVMVEAAEIEEQPEPFPAEGDEVVGDDGEGGEEEED
ncbi:Radial spoke head protein 4 A [Perkinsus olseni]|uniref:Radial spoke head protein 4 A n=1 Tax=Perkinsus olseni TaxID=32597 RepID=A0A7J6QZI2_PEROL|nr:Radial spoke head protein 4 A [Perkinsus olseni]